MDKREAAKGLPGFAAGLDGGGTKTAVCCVDARGQVLGRQDFGALNLNGAPPAQVRETLVSIIAWIACHEAAWGPCRSMVVGTAGASNPSAVQWIRDSILGAGYQGFLTITGDQPTALRGAVGKVGAVLIAGTGTICYGRNASGKSHRCGGYGYLIDDEGSGYAIGRDILSAVVRASDGREEPTALAPWVFERLDISGIPELIREVYAHAHEKSHIASFAPLLLQGLDQGDAACQRIAQKAAKELAHLLQTVLTALELQEGSFAFVGGILQHYPAIAQEVLRQIGESLPHAQHIQPRGDAALGAALLALEQEEGGAL